MNRFVGGERRRELRRRVWIGLASASLTALACGSPPGGWDPSALENAGFDLKSGGGRRLADSPPYFTPSADGISLFLCRWSTGAPVPVSLPPDATERERNALRAALAAWEGADLGVTFREVRRSRASLVVAFSPQFDADAWSGDTVADCAIPGDFDAPSGQARIPADLVYASILMQRTRADALGREIHLSDAELVGAAVHELGHALGYPGHVSRGRSVMGRDVGDVRTWGDRVLRGEALSDPALESLYSVPSGTVVGHLDVSDAARRELRAVTEAALSASLRGPFVRVGDHSARLFWRGGGGRAEALTIGDWRRVLQRREDLSFDEGDTPGGLHPVASAGTE